MGSATVCRPRQGGQSSPPGGVRAAPGSPPDTTLTLPSSGSAASARPEGRITEARITPGPGHKVHRVDDRTTQAALRSARRIRRGPISVSCVPDIASRPRVSYAVGRRVGGAVQRNLVRRRLRAAMQELAPTLTGRAWLVGASPEASDLHFVQLRSHCSAAVDELSR